MHEISPKKPKSFEVNVFRIQIINRKLIIVAEVTGLSPVCDGGNLLRNRCLRLL